jgi:NADPH-dependent 2,4-dienoyl-CoA reductase/sulfur reductase-like enzyme
VPETVTFTLDGRPIQARAGQSVAGALLAAGVEVLTRSPKYRRPRGIYCAGGYCPNCLVSVDGVPHVRACMVPARDGLQVELDGSAAKRLDPYRAADRLAFLLPLGFQYRYFKRQSFAWRAWERRLRAAAAETRMPEPGDVPPAERVEADLLVVGGGPAGIGAAAAAARVGLRVVLASRRGLGGRARPVPPPEVSAAVEELRASPRVRLVTPATVVAGFDGRFVVDAGMHALEVTARSSVLATGAYERGLVFEGNDRPGVMLSSALRRLVLEEGVLAHSTAVLAGTDGGINETAAELRAAGVTVAAVLDREPLAVVGSRHVRAVRLEGGASIRCDVVGISGGWQAADELRFQATSSGTAIVAGERARPLDEGAGPLPLLQGIGAVVGTRTAAAAFAEGLAAGARAAA